MRTFLSAFLVCCAAAAFAYAPANASTCLRHALSAYTGSNSAAHAFDFYEGTWTVQMRQRQVDAQLRPASSWTEFPATVSVRRVLQGGGFVEEYRLNKAAGTKYALGTRLYDPKSNSWAIYWSNKGEGEWQPPARGGVVTPNGIDIIYDDTWGSRAILTRYRWITSDPNHPTWEQSFSGNCGATWVANWTMRFTRTSKL